MSEREPWAYVALRDGKIRAWLTGDASKPEYTKFYQECAGLDMRIVYSREEYDTLWNAQP